MTRKEAMQILNAAPGKDKVAKLLALDPGTMIDVMMALNPGCGIVDIAKWHARVTA
jgi:hypothetical protein